MENNERTIMSTQWNHACTVLKHITRKTGCAPLRCRNLSVNLTGRDTRELSRWEIENFMPLKSGSTVDWSEIRDSALRTIDSERGTTERGKSCRIVKQIAKWRPFIWNKIERGNLNNASHFFLYFFSFPDVSEVKRKNTILHAESTSRILYKRCRKRCANE